MEHGFFDPTVAWDLDFHFLSEGRVEVLGGGLDGEGTQWLFGRDITRGLSTARRALVPDCVL